MPHRITVVCQGVPYPPNHGGKLDAWNLIRGMRDAGADVQLVYWVDPAGESVSHEIAAVSPSAIQLRRRQGIWRAFYAKYPPRMVSFTVGKAESRRLVEGVRAFRPDWILLDSWIGFLTGRQLSRELGVPLAYRSQNVEHLYFKELLRVARGSLKLRIAANALRMRWVETRLREEVDLVLDISAEDALHWGASLPANVEVVPPLWLDRVPTAASSVDIDVLFVGNLHTPNNVEGLHWFTREVLPILRRALPQRRVVFAGASPAARDQRIWESAGIECIPNPDDPRSLYPRAKVLVNPQRRGSGVPLKMLEVLASRRPVVATRIGVKGLPPEAAQEVRVADTAEVFARLIASLLIEGAPPVSEADRGALMRRCFGQSNIDRAFQRMDAISGKRR